MIKYLEACFSALFDLLLDLLLDFSYDFLTDFWGTGDLLFYLEADFLLGVLDLEDLPLGTDNFASIFIKN